MDIRSKRFFDKWCIKRRKQTEKEFDNIDFHFRKLGEYDTQQHNQARTMARARAENEIRRLEVQLQQGIVGNFLNRPGVMEFMIEVFPKNKKYKRLIKLAKVFSGESDNHSYPSVAVRLGLIKTLKEYQHRTIKEKSIYYVINNIVRSFNRNLEKNLFTQRLKRKNGNIVFK